MTGQWRTPKSSWEELVPIPSKARLQKKSSSERSSRKKRSVKPQKQRTGRRSRWTIRISPCPGARTWLGIMSPARCENWAAYLRKIERGLKPATTFRRNVIPNVVAGFSPRSIFRPHRTKCCESLSLSWHKYSVISPPGLPSQFVYVHGTVKLPVHGFV